MSGNSKNGNKGELLVIKNVQTDIMLNIRKLGKRINNISESVFDLITMVGEKLVDRNKEEIENMERKSHEANLINILSQIRDAISQLTQKIEESMHINGLKSSGKQVIISCKYITF